MQRLDFTLTTDAGGAASVLSSDVANGTIRQIRYVPDGVNPLATGADLAITAAGSGLVIDTLTDIGVAAVQWAPRQATSTVAGVASLYAAAGTAVNDQIAIANERIQVVVAQGGNVKTGTLYIWVG